MNDYEPTIVYPRTPATSAALGQSAIESFDLNAPGGAAPSASAGSVGDVRQEVSAVFAGEDDMTIPMRANLAASLHQAIPDLPLPQPQLPVAILLGVEGGKKGQIKPLYFGRNVLNDVIISFDELNKCFYIQPREESSCMCYLGTSPILQAQALASPGTIRMGAEGSWRFIAICNEEFSW